MDTGLILRVAGVGLLVSVLYQVLSKTGRDEMAIVLVMLVDEIGALLGNIRSLFGI